MAANTITVASPKAAIGVSKGLILSTDGRIRPRAPNISLKPMKRTILSEKELTNDIPFAAKSSIGEVIFMIPAIINAKANKPCATHKPILRAFDCFNFLVFSAQTYGVKKAPALM